MAAWLQGFHREIAGEVITYHAPLPGVTSALLTRCQADWPPVAWESEPVIAPPAAETVDFCFAFGIQAQGEPQRFELSVGERPALVFASPRRAAIAVRRFRSDGEADAAELALGASLIDRHGDVMGFARLRVPAAWIVAGAPLRLQVAAPDVASPCWWMTFRTALPRRPWAVALPALERSAAGDRQPVEVHALNLQDEPVVLKARAVATRSATPSPNITAAIPFGHHRRTLRLPPVAAPERTRLAVSLGTCEPAEVTCERGPVRPWSLDLVQHTHTDIGYTRPQPEILAAHAQYIDQALALCDRTDHLPDPARFRWTCEVSWPLRFWWHSRSRAERDRLRRRVAEGRIEPTALPLNMSEILPEELLPDFLAPLREIVVEGGLPVSLAMQNDVNGIAWALADLLPAAGVTQLVMGEHGHRALVPFDRPTPFWWRGPGGGRLLAFRADHYNTANVWGLPDGDVEAVAAGLFRYLTDLEEAGYAFDRVAAQFSGHFLDNAPPSSAACELVRAWNERFAWPRLRLATAGEFPRWVAQMHGDALPELELAWPDWWTDGVGSAPRETRAFRRGVGAWLSARALAAAAQLAAGEKSAAAAQVAPAPLVRDAAAAAPAIFYAEHTFGAHDSISEPGNAGDCEQWGHKAGFAWQWRRRAILEQERVWGSVQSRLGPPAGGPPVTRTSDIAALGVFNPSGWSRSDLVTVFVPHAMAGSDVELALRTAGGLNAGQIAGRRPEGAFWTFRSGPVPPLGVVSGAVAARAQPTATPTAPMTGATSNGLAAAGDEELSNDRLRLRWDPHAAAVVSLIDRHGDRELVDGDAGLGLGRLLRETITSRRELEAWRCESAARVPITGGRLRSGGRGPLWSWLAGTATLTTPAGPAHLHYEIRLLNDEPRVIWRLRLRKPACLAPEAWYVAFPFALADAEVRYDLPGAMVRPVRDQISGTANDWHTVQSVVALRHAAGQLHWSTPDVPLVQLGGLHLGRFAVQPPEPGPHVYSWVANNYWVTNFRPSWEGEFAWRYVLELSEARTDAAALRAGRAALQPLLGRVLPRAEARAGVDQGVTAPDSAADVLSRGLGELPANLQLLALRPGAVGGASAAPGGVIAHLREVEGRAARLDVAAWLRRSTARAIPLDALLRARGAAERTIAIAPRATVLLRLLPA